MMDHRTGRKTLGKGFAHRGCAATLMWVAAMGVLFIATPAGVLAGGFQINEQSARGTAMGGAMAASIDDPTAVHVNPAVLALLHGTNLSFGATVIVPDYRFNGVAPAQSTTKMHPQALFPPNIYLSFSLGGGVAFGISALIPYSLKSEWDPDWVGRRISVKSELQSVFLTPTLAYEASSRLSFGISLDLVSSKLLFSQRVGFEPIAASEGTATYQGDTRFDYGYQVGMLYRPVDVLSLGVAYRSMVSVDVPDGKASTGFKTPDNIYVGAGIRPLEFLTIQGDIQYVIWSRFKSPSIAFANFPQSVVFPGNWENCYSARLGAELAVGGIALRLGIVYDQSPIPNMYASPTLPDVDKTGYSAGIGSTVGENLRLDFALMQYGLAERIVTDSKIEYLSGQFFNGSYSGSSTVFALNVSYNWK